MLSGRFNRPLRQNQAQIAVSPAPTFQQHAIIIGAGLAGAAVAERLATRGWQIELFEQHSGPAQGASGNPAGIILPRPAKDDALGSRLSRASYLYALRRLSSLQNVRWSPCGVLQIARDAAHEVLQRATSDALKLPHEYLQFFERTDAEALIGHPLAHGGWWFPGGGWVSPGSLCAALIKESGSHLTKHYNTAVTAITHDGQHWMAFDSHGNELAKASYIVLANAHAANALLPAPLPLTPVRGQISYLPQQTLAGVRHVLCRTGYLTPPESGVPCVGASFDHDDAELDLRVADHEGNLQRLDELLPGTAHGINPATLDGRVGLRTATIDRLPMAGALPDTQARLIDRPLDPSLARLPRLPCAFGLLGLGARGMVWAPLAAELIASQMHGDPLPMERELVDAIDPGRFHLRALRRGA
jgi:tRNA 5-methylaminomethyl-2-thiouridine biosynthesis bifunctional protein